jgi:plasmid stabilization system protein ParE
MTAKLTWHPQAREDLLLIYEFIGLDDSDAAERVVTTIENKAKLPIRYSRMGARRHEIRPATRIVFEGPYLIPY